MIVHLILLLLWIAIGTGLRFTNLALKPPWNDEFATLVFSLGNSFRTVQLDQPLTLDTLLMPLQPNSEAGISAVINHLMTESTHPPVYFVLTHLWMQLFPTEGGLVSIWAARALPAVLGVISIPAVFALGWLAFRSRLVAQLTAALMAVSPYGVYLAQEARHYTLAILLIIASLGCLVTAVRTIHRQIPLPLWIVFVWVGVNSLGIAVHYFFTLTLCAEGLVLLRFWILDCVRRLSINRKMSQFRRDSSHLYKSSDWWRIYAAVVGTLIGSLVWLPVWQNVPDNQLTQWIYDGSPLSNWLVTLGRIFSWMITMLVMLPVEGVPVPILIVCILVTVIFLGWLLPILISGLRIQLMQPGNRQETLVFAGFLSAVIVMFLGITFGLGADLSIAARYHFVYFPAVIVLLGAALAVCWEAATLSAEFAGMQRQQSLLHYLEARGKKAVAITLLVGLLGGVTVIFNLGYQKPDRPDLLVPIIHEVSQVPVLIATTHETHEQTREMMELAWEFKRFYREESSRMNSPQFLLAHQEPGSNTSREVLQKTVSQLSRPLDLWVVNFLPSAEPEIDSCFLDKQARPKMNGYKHRLYHCP